MSHYQLPHASVDMSRLELWLGCEFSVVDFHHCASKLVSACLVVFGSFDSFASLAGTHRSRKALARLLLLLVAVTAAVVDPNHATVAACDSVGVGHDGDFAAAVYADHFAHLRPC